MKKVGAIDYLETKSAPPSRDIIEAMHLAADDVVIELGAGACRLTLPIAKRLKEMRGAGVLVSCDFSRTWEREIKKACAKTDLDKQVLTVCLSDIRAHHLPVQTTRVDCVLAINSLHYMKKPLPYLREVHRVLRNTGELIIADWDLLGADETQKAPQPPLGPDQMVALLKEAGLGIREILDLDGYTWAMRVAKTAIVKRKTPISIIPISLPKLSYSS